MPGSRAAAVPRFESFPEPAATLRVTRRPGGLEINPRRSRARRRTLNPRPGRSTRRPITKPAPPGPHDGRGGAVSLEPWNMPGPPPAPRVSPVRIAPSPRPPAPEIETGLHPPIPPEAALRVTDAEAEALAGAPRDPSRERLAAKLRELLAAEGQDGRGSYAAAYGALAAVSELLLVNLERSGVVGSADA